MRAFVHTEYMCLRNKQKKKKKKKKKKNAGLVEEWGVPDKMALRDFSIAKVLLKLCGYTCTCWFRTVLVICFLGRRLILHVSIFYCKDPKTLIRLRRCTCRHMLIHKFAGQMFLWNHFIFHLSFFLFLQKFSPAHISLTLYLLQRPRSNCMMFILMSYQSYLIPHFT